MKSRLVRVGDKDMSNELKFALYNEFRKLKTHFFNNITLFYEKIEIAKVDESLQSNIYNLADLITRSNIKALVHLGPRAFEEISGEVVQSVAFVLQKGK